jgi:quercetin dioxygenase-like cupin family protein
MDLNIVKLSDIPAKEVGGHKGFAHRPLVNLPEKGVTIRMINVVPGGVGPVPAHSHSDVHFFYVLEGHLELTVDGAAHSVPKGCCVEVPANTMHQLRSAGESDMTVLAIKWE